MFLAGSFAGLIVQAQVHPDVYLLGASAGISAVMGAFFAFFYWAEFHFMFALGFLYFKRIVMPLVWVFPAFFVMADFTAVLSRENNGVAHMAYLVGFFVGCGFGFLHRKLFSVPKGHLFSQEVAHLNRLRATEHPVEIWNLFNDLMKWNSQNSEAVHCFLVKGSLRGVVLRDKEEMKLCNRYISVYMSRCFRLGRIEDIIHAVEHFPPKFPLADFISEVPLRQIRGSDFGVGDHSREENHGAANCA